MEKIFQAIVREFGPEKAVDFVICYLNMEGIRNFARSVQDMPVELKGKLAEHVIQDGKWYDAYYFLQLVRNIPEPMIDRLLNKARVHKQEDRDVIRRPIV